MGRYQTVDPGRYQTVDPGRYQTVDPGRYQTVDPGRYQTVDLGKYQTVDPGRYQNLDPGRYQNIGPGRYQTVDLGRYLTVDIGRYQMVDIGKYQTVDIGRYLTVDPGRSVGVTGSIETNGHPRQMRLFHKLSAYIQQEDLLQPRLTVLEAMRVAADLKLGDELDHEEKSAVVEEVMESLFLKVCRDTRTEKLSGGQRKRLVFAHLSRLSGSCSINEIFSAGHHQGLATALFVLRSCEQQTKLLCEVSLAARLHPVDERALCDRWTFLAGGISRSASLDGRTTPCFSVWSHAECTGVGIQQRLTKRRGKMGLDVVTVKKCITLLKILARQGRTIVCTIHQPTSTLLAEFDNVYVIAKGQCVYQGDSSQIVPFLGRLGLNCPTTYNPADYSQYNHYPSIDNTLTALSFS
uniref:ABC transporter domain-containing protein n=1 Tax=Timema douglasi TaxID=61478 RepID=A0A7R8VY28_TIMDO|nr:unnamed protein product [Timema douglasi]